MKKSKIQIVMEQTTENGQKKQAVEVNKKQEVGRW
jgi:hypothetical protein